MMDAKIHKIVERNFKPGFKIKLHDKDIKNALATASGLQVPLPLTALVEQMLAALMVAGKGELDHSAMIQFVEKMAHVEVRKDS